MATSKNFSYSTVAVAPSPAESGTSLDVATGTGTLFAVGCLAVIYPTGAAPLASTSEIVLVSAIAGDTLTITRAQESTAARTVIAGDQIAQVLTAGMWNGVEPWAGLSPSNYAALSSSPTWTGLHTWSRSIAANTTGNGIGFTNPNAATSGNQRYSPALELEGFGWKTSIPAASQSTKWRMFALPVQGTAAPSVNLLFQYQVNGGSWTTGFTAKSTGEFLVGTNDVSRTGSPTFASLTLSGNLTMNGVGSMVQAQYLGFYNSNADESGGSIRLVLDNPGADGNQYDLTFVTGGNSNRTLGILSNWTLGDYSATAPTATGKISVTINGQAYEIPARLVP